MCPGILHTGVSTSWPSLPGWSQWEPRQTFCEQIWTGVWREYTRSLQSVCVQLGERVIREHNNISYFLLSTFKRDLRHCVNKVSKKEYKMNALKKYT